MIGTALDTMLQLEYFPSGILHEAIRCDCFPPPSPPLMLYRLSPSIHKNYSKLGGPSLPSKMSPTSISNCNSHPSFVDTWNYWCNSHQAKIATHHQTMCLIYIHSYRHMRCAGAYHRHQTQVSLVHFRLVCCTVCI